jgi:hypothetical protein
MVVGPNLSRRRRQAALIGLSQADFPTTTARSTSTPNGTDAGD